MAEPQLEFLRGALKSGFDVLLGGPDVVRKTELGWFPAHHFVGRVPQHEGQPRVHVDGAPLSVQKPHTYIARLDDTVRFSAGTQRFQSVPALVDIRIHPNDALDAPMPVANDMPLLSTHRVVLSGRITRYSNTKSDFRFTASEIADAKPSRSLGCTNSRSASCVPGKVPGSL